MPDWPHGPESQSPPGGVAGDQPAFSPPRSCARRIPVGAVVGLCCLWGGVFGGKALGASDSAVDRVIEQVTVGRAGASRIGHWTTVRVRVGPGQPGRKLSVRVAAADPDDQWAFTQGPMQAMGADGAGNAEAAFRVSRPESGLRVELLDEAGQVIEQQRVAYETPPEANSTEPSELKTLASPPWRHDVPVWATVGQPGGLTGKKTLSGGRRILSLKPDDLPTLREGYGGIDALILSTGSDDWSRITAPQWQAMGEWVRNGGHLALSVGANASAVATSPLMSWLPIPIQESRQVRQLGRLESYCGAGTPVSFTGAIPRAKLGAFRGVNLVDDNDGSLLGRAPLGFGLVTVLAVDIDLPPLTTWQGVVDLAPLLLESAVDRTRLQSAAEASRRHQGLSDLGSQVATALDQFPQVRRASYWTVLGQLLALLVIVGPLDYLLTNRWLKRPTLTWLTLPLWLVAGFIGAGSVARACNGEAPLANQWTILDYDATGRDVRGTAWTTVYSPGTSRLEIAVQPETIGGVSIPESRMSWIAEPEGSPGGLYRGSGLTGGRSTYELTTDGAAKRPVIPQWSTKAFLSEWSVPSTSKTAWVESQLESSGPTRLSGSITWNLEEPLEEFFLVFGGRVYFAQGRQSRLLAFQPWEPTGPQGQQRDLRAYLTGTTGRRVQVSGSREELQFRAQPYNPLDFDPLRLVRMLTFHEVTGGRPYTGMDHRLLAYLELSSQMNVGQAILLGQIQRAGAAVRINGQPLDFSTGQAGTQATFIRALLPVKVYFEEEKLIDKEMRERLQQRPSAPGNGS